MSAPPHILVVDDDDHLRNVVRFALEQAGFTVSEAHDGEQALRSYDAQEPKLVVLDVMMPRLDGLEVCRRLRARAATPIVFLSARDDVLDKVVGLELGGDDYIPKPFSPRELVARVRAVLRRGSPLAGPATTNERVTHGLLVMDAARFEVWWGDAPIVLTVTEFALLRCLVSSPGRVFTRSQLMQAAYDEPHVVSDRTIDSHIRRLRKKLGVVGCTLLETVHGMGYKV